MIMATRDRQALAAEQYQKQFMACQANLMGHELPWLVNYREKALQAFMRQGFPTLRHEQWKYTSLNALIGKPLEPLLATRTGVPSEQELVAQFALPDCYPIVLIDGVYTPQASCNSLPAGVTVMSLSTAVRERYQPVVENLGSIYSVDKHPFAALNGAFAEQGIVFHLAPFCVLDKPLQILHITTGQAHNKHFHPHHILLLDEASQALVIESSVASSSTCYFINRISEVILGDGAQLSHYQHEQDSPEAYHIAGIHVRQGRDSRYTSHSLALGGRLVRNDIQTHLTAPGAQTILNGLYCLAGRQHVDHHTLIHHHSGETHSEQYYKGVLADHSHAVFNGKIIVDKDAQQSDSTQSNKNLLLSDHCEVNTKPELEIYADNIRCAHGATVGQLDEEAVLYLRSRGIDDGRARALLTYAFVREILDRIKVPSLLDTVTEHVLQKLNQGNLLKGWITP